MSKTWDLIVVGAGSAGAALATRSAEQGRSVLLLEAGIDYRSAELPPAFRSANPINGILSPHIDDYLWTDLNASRTRAQDQALYWRGKGVGGSSTVNGQIAIRPPLEDFDLWLEAGCQGWSRDDVLPYFCRLEADGEFGGEAYHGTAGPTPIYRAPVETWGAVDTALSTASLGQGFGWAPDVNAPGATGVSPYPINSHDSLRVSTNDAYLEGARSLPNLEIRGGCLVDSVVFDGTRAVGVTLADSGDTLHADEVALCAGVIHSPAILMRSGIGPRTVLEPAGIDLRVDLPVGRGMQDHPMSLIGIPLKDEFAATPEDRHTNLCVRYSSGKPGLANDMMMVALNQNLLAMGAADVSFAAGAVGVWVNLAYSRGSVAIVSADPHVQPLVEENMLSDPRDVDRLRDGIRLLANLVEGDAFRRITSVDPWSENAELRAALDGSDGDLDAYLLATVADTQHGTSTCRMGRVDDDDTVVDPDCRVLGTEALRVVDASIFPFVPRANTNLASIMVGELMSDRMNPTTRISS